MKRLLALLLPLCLLIFAACAASEPAEEPSSLTACLGPARDSFDPQTGGVSDADIYSLHLFEGLMRYAPSDQPAGDDANVAAAEVTYGQAESWEVSEDGLTYTFRLRDDLFWSDGSKVIAGDFVFAWQRLVDPACGCPEGRLLAGIVSGASAILAGEADPGELGIYAPSYRTLKVSLERPAPWFPELTARPALSPLPQGRVREYGSRWAEAEHLVSNGPFRLAEWGEDHIRLVRGEYYYGREQLGPGSLTFCFRNTETELLQLFREEGCSFIQGFPTAATKELTADGLCHALPRPGECLIQFNCAALPDWRVRAALSLAVDGEKLTQDLLQGGQSPAAGLVDPFVTTDGGGSFRELSGPVLIAALSAAYPAADLESAEGRRALARQLLEAAQADGFDAAAPRRLICGQGAVQQAVADAVSADVRDALGLELTVEPLDADSFAQALAAGDFAAARMAWTPEQADALFYLDMFTSAGAYNYGGWYSPRYDRLLQQAKQTPAAEREALLVQAERSLFQPGGFPCLPLYNYGCQYCMRGLTGLVYAPRAGFLFHWAQPLPEAEAEAAETETEAAGTEEADGE